MIRSPRRRNLLRAIAPITLFILPLAGFFAPRAGQALPLYSRRYNVPCETCHSVAPRLNHFGLAFQANHFRWPGGDPPVVRNTLAAVPVSGLAIASHYDNRTFHITTSDFNTLELFTSNSFTLGGADRAGGYFIDYFAIVKSGQAGELDNAFVSVPVAGMQGQLALTAGQFEPMSYQFDTLNNLTRSLPSALNNTANAFSFIHAVPGLRLEYYDRRGSANPTGNYVSLGVPFDGQLEWNDQSRLYSTTRGAYVHAFHRWGEDSAGLFGYERSGSHLVGLLGTKTVATNLHLLAAESSAHDPFGSTDNLSLQAEYVFNPQLALTGRVESVRGASLHRTNFPVMAVTGYPFKLKILRLTGETIQAPGNRSIAVYAFGQF